MGSTSSIEWTDATWPVVKGCDYVSPGCANCYAVDLIHRHSGNPNAKISLPVAGLTEERNGRARWTGKVYLNEPHLGDPLRWKRGRMIFVPSHGDLFHDDVPDQFIRKVFGVMSSCGQHTFQVLTKRPARMRRWFENPENRLSACQAEYVVAGAAGMFTPGGENRIRDTRAINGTDCNDWPLPNVWLGVSVEDQQRADERIPELLKVPAAVRFLSCEPLLGPVRLGGWCMACNAPVGVMGAKCHTDTRWPDWVIVGGESGRGARQLRVEWVRALVRQCQAARVACFVKQLGRAVIDRNDHFGGWADVDWPDTLDPLSAVEHDIHGFYEVYQGADCRIWLNDRKGGDPTEWPADLRVREFPRGLTP